MKVIQENPFAFELECRGCKSKLQAEAEDVAVDYFSSMGERSRHYYVTCPICDADQLLENKILTPKVRAMADKKEKR